MNEIRYHKDVLLFLDGLFDILIDEGYFSFYETSALYIEDLVAFVGKSIHTAPHKVAPAYFSRYGRNLYYILYNRNKHTTWYIFFEKTSLHYYIRHITNNHVAGKYF